MDTHYSAQRNVQILIALMKAHHIKKVIASPGTTNISFVASIQQDPYFEIYSSAEERSAAYMACGLAAESGEPVAISCTGATASRNYLPGMTEAFYRKLPVLAITSTLPIEEYGHNFPQVIDRTGQLKDAYKMSVYLPEIHSEVDEWACQVNVNKAILELRHHGGGPVHINLMTNYSPDFSVKTLPKVRPIYRIECNDSMPKLEAERIAVFVGAHLPWSDELTQAVDEFCEAYNAVVLCDQTSNYPGKYGVMANLVVNQKLCLDDRKQIDVLIHIGDVSGAYMKIKPKNVWRVNPDGEIRDPFKRIQYVFEMPEALFFRRYTQAHVTAQQKTSYANGWKQSYENIKSLAASKADQIPFSNPWIALQTLNRIPQGSVLHLGILNTLRSWSFFDAPKGVTGYANVGGFGIDGCVSALLGSSLASENRLYFGVVGDLAFFYDMNSLGNRHIGKNVRLMIINNGRGVEFRTSINLAMQAGLADRADTFVAAAGHYGNQSRTLVKHYAEDLGFEYMAAADKQTYLRHLDRFVAAESLDCPIIFEVFTQTDHEREALDMILTLEENTKGKMKQLAKDVIGEKNLRTIKKIISK